MKSININLYVNRYGLIPNTLAGRGRLYSVCCKTAGYVELCCKMIHSRLRQTNPIITISTEESIYPGQLSLLRSAASQQVYGLLQIEREDWMII